MDVQEEATANLFYVTMRYKQQKYQGLSHSAQGKPVGNQYLMMGAVGKSLIFLLLNPCQGGLRPSSRDERL
jgi:hypothetical protein